MTDPYQSPNSPSQQPGGYQPQPSYPGPQGQPQGMTPPPGNPYGQPPVGGYHPQQPYGQPMNTKPQRPGKATAAGVLGIVSGSLGIPVGIAGITVLSALQSLTSAIRLSTPNLDLLIALSYIQVFGTFVAAIMLLVAGIVFLNRKGYLVLLIGAIMQGVLTLLSLVSSTMNDVNNGLTILFALIGLGLAGSTIYLLFTPEVKRWKS